MFHGVTIAGIGSYLPPRIVTNHDLEKMVDTNDEWIRSRTGIEQRHIADENEPTSALGAQAALNALKDAGIQAEDVDLIICATISPDEPWPNTGCHIQRRIGAKNAMCFGLEAACTGFVYAFEVGANMVRAGGYKNVLVIGTEKMSSIVNWKDRNTCVLFGDGAGAVVLTQTDVEKDCLIASEHKSNGKLTEILGIPGGGCLEPITSENIDDGLQYLRMDGPTVFKQAVSSMVRACKKALEKSGLTKDQIKWVIPHQANKRIIDAVGKGVGVDPAKVYVNVNRYGNTSSATIPIALDEIVKGDLVCDGDYILYVAFGGGLTGGASIVRWGK